MSIVHDEVLQQPREHRLALGHGMPCVEDADDNAALLSFASDHLLSDTRCVWLGLSDVPHGVGSWEAGCSSGFTQWHSGEPNDRNGNNEDFVGICANINH